MKTRLHAGVALAFLLSIACAFPSYADDEMPGNYTVEGLQRISLASLPDWESNWEYSRAIAAATILAWLHANGYVGFLDDWNGDGAIDERDTVELADHLAKDWMRCEQAPMGTDTWLVAGLARYVAGRYPNAFEFRIYDPGFPEEFERLSGILFAPDAIPGIRLAVEAEPTFWTYQAELLDGSGVIVGLEEETGRNVYLTGHSFRTNPVGPDTLGMGLLSPQDEGFAAGTQGRILEAAARQMDALRIDFRGEWMKAESMVVLRSLLPQVSVSSRWDCNEDRSACMGTVEADVKRARGVPIESEFDLVLEVFDGVSSRTIVETVTPEEINPTGQMTVLFTFPIPSPDRASAPCTYSLDMLFPGDRWALGAFIGAVVAVPEAIHGDESGNGLYYGSGCCEDVPDCLDLVISADCQRCDCEDTVEETWHPEPVHPRGGWWETEVIGVICEAKIRCIACNLGTIDAGPFSVRIETSSGYTEIEGFGGIPFGGSVSTWVEFTVEESGPISITVIVDCEDTIEECDEQNNTAQVMLFCY